MARGPWIETYTGKKFYLLDPQPEDICIEDIAHALSNQCRFTGHTKHFYSVAEHCWHASFLCPQTHALLALLHDAPETYISDLSRPLKHHTPIGPYYMEIEDRIMQAICVKYGLDRPMTPEVKEADNKMLWIEKAALMTDTSWETCSAECAPEMRGSLNERTILSLYPILAEYRYLDRFTELTGIPTYGSSRKSELITISEKMPLPTKG